MAQLYRIPADPGPFGRTLTQEAEHLRWLRDVQRWPVIVDDTLGWSDIFVGPAVIRVADRARLDFVIEVYAEHHRKLGEHLDRVVAETERRLFGDTTVYLALDTTQWDRAVADTTEAARRIQRALGRGHTRFRSTKAGLRIER